MLITCDLHLTDRKQDEYRFGIFEWLAEQQAEYDCSCFAILGDITDKKDYHSSKLVNRVVEELSNLAEIAPVLILLGNHDYQAEDSPFFMFLNHMKNIRFIRKPTLIDRKLFIPHCHEWPDLDQYTGKADYAFLHQTVTGAVAEAGTRLSGLPVGPIEALGVRRAFSGDVHKPQTVGNITYVGAPYHVRFNDRFDPRVIILDDKKDEITELTYPAPRKLSLTIRDASEIKQHGVQEGDQVKINLELAREELIEYPTYKQQVRKECQRLGLQIFDLKLKPHAPRKRVKLKEAPTVEQRRPDDVVAEFGKKEKLPSKFIEMGKELLNV